MPEAFNNNQGRPFGWTAVPEPGSIFSNTNDRRLSLTFEFGGHDAVGGLSKATVVMPRNQNTFTISVEGRNFQQAPGQTLAPAGGDLLHAGDEQRISLSPLMAIATVLANTVYLGSFRNALVGAQGSYFDIQVGQAFVTQFKQMKSGAGKAQNEAIYQLIGDIKRIFRFTDLDINPSGDDQTLQFFINGHSFQLQELGAGITHFIIALTAASTRRPALLLIDEPELNLHATMQTDLLSTLATYASYGVWFSTHSYGLARAVADRIYTIQPSGDGRALVRPVEDTPRLSELLGELGFYSFRELGFDSVLLVEGATDLRTIQQMLRQYGKDHSILVLPLGGASLIRGDVDLELAELTRITPKIFAVIDSERKSGAEPPPPDRLAFKQACEKASIACHILERRAIENYFPDSAVKQVFGPKYRGLQPYEALTDVSPSWGKRDNWKIARAMTQTELDATDLGQFLARLSSPQV